METKHLQILKPFIRTTARKATMPILENAKVENGKMMVFDLETCAIFPTSLPDGLYTHIEGEFFKNETANPEDYPLHPLTGKVNYQQKVTLLPGEQASPLALAHIAACVAADKLRPVMNSVFITSKHMVASDAHVMKYLPVKKEQVTNQGTNDKGEEIPLEFLTTVPQVLASALKKYPKCSVNITKFVDPEKPDTSGSLRYTFVDKGFEIIVRETEGTYPVWKSVLPKIEQYEHAVLFSQNEAKEFHKFAKKINPETNRLVFNNNQPVTRNIETNLEKEFPAVQVTGIPDREPDGLIMPFMLSDEQKDEDKAIAINTQNLMNVTSGFKGTITLARNTDPARGCYFWLTPENSRKSQAASCKQQAKTKTQRKPQVPDTYPKTILYEAA